MNNHSDSKQLAGLIGPTLIALSLSEALNLDIWTSITAQVLAPLIYLNSTILFVAGLAIVRTHNRWVSDWRVLVTPVGWLVMLGGLFRMFIPVSGQVPVQNPAVVYAVFAIILLVGVVLTFQSYRREND
jgi:hypothetical protein